MHSSLELVYDRFPHVREIVAHLFERNEDFRELCDEYEACGRAVARLESVGPSADAMRKEYVALLLRLERELLVHLEAHSGRNEA